jgi:hypothetical protein
MKRKTIPGEEYKSVEAFYVTQFNNVLLKEEKEIERLKKACAALKRKVKKSYNCGYNQGYADGLVEYWAVE